MDLVYTAYFESAADTPLVAPATLPTIRIRRLDTNALVITDVDTVEVGDGLFKYRFTGGLVGVEYAARVDGDPIAATQVASGSRYQAAGSDLVLSDLHEVAFQDRVWNKVGNKIFIYTDATRTVVRHEFDVNADLSDIAPV